MVVPGDGDGGLDIGTSSITPALSPSGPSAITSVAGAPCRNPIPSSELPRRTAAHPTAKSARWSRYPKKETVQGVVASCATAGGGARRTVACSDGTAYGFSRIISLSPRRRVFRWSADDQFLCLRLDSRALCKAEGR
jgi:hypothetical protein